MFGVYVVVFLNGFDLDCFFYCENVKKTWLGTTN